MPSDVDLCIVCNAKWIVDADYIEVFSEEPATETDLHLATLVYKLLNKEIKPDYNKFQFICKKCFTLLSELEELQTRVNEIKSEILVQRISDDDCIKQELVDKSQENDVDVTKKLLFIPSSDEDSVQISADKSSFQDIHLELDGIHGVVDIDQEIEQQQKENEMEIEASIEYQGFSTDDGEIILDTGAIEQSSDEDFDLSKNVQLKNVSLGKTASFVDVPINNQDIHLKLTDANKSNSTEVDKKPIILRKKHQQIISESASNEDDKKSESTVSLPVVSKEGNLYTCLLCEGDETVAGEAKAIIAHAKDAHDLRLYICDVCGQDFCKRNQLSAHMDEHVAAEEGDFQCEVCNRIFTNLRLFRIHKRMHYPQSKAWVCDTCGKKYSSKNLLEEHVNTHLGLRPYVCGVCGKDFASKYTYKAHEKTHELRPRPYKCAQCNKSFLNQQNLTQHERTHLGMKEYTCSLCNKQFGSMHNLEVHSIVHTGYKPFVCGLCGKAFARKAEIRDHERTHTGERPYQCEFCGATFSQRSNLQSHKRATHYDDKRYQCTVCGKGFKRRRLLDYHIKAAHTGERPYKCETCEATFVYPEHFKKHRRIHTGEKPFLCEVCGKAFNSRDNRNAHRFIHSDKKPYECLICGAGFMRKPLLYQHMQARGHLNDTIVVNQPRLTTTEDDPLATVNAAEVTEMFEEATTTEHIIIDGQQISFAEVGSDDENEEIEEMEQVVAEQTDEDYEEEIITSDALANGETQIIETSEGPMQLIKVRIPKENGEEEEAWIKIVPE
ncbi:unnamed protein product [Phyllotreta striolata]|uniref:C2H2-type domain-containing protein n=1 Tax=Phyllotreta striolata TaxID=444603 RepID=A0A9N9XNR3_PHYSR|nr:unnamed protein product [Phyllotreta striolata]